MKRLYIFLSVLVLICLPLGYYAYQLFGAAFHCSQELEIRVRKNWTMDSLEQVLTRKAGFEKSEALHFWAPKLGYTTVQPCFVRIYPGMSLYRFIAVLRKERNQTRNVVIKEGMGKDGFMEALLSKIEVDRDSLLRIISFPGNQNRWNLNDTNWAAFMVPNTYNFYVRDGLDAFLHKMEEANKQRWNAHREEAATKQKLSPEQVSILASIVQKESNYRPEYGKIAGVYINRLRKGMLLQADPTIVFIRKESGRVKYGELKLESPYNTYLHKGLPPGPLCVVGNAAIDSVLHYSSHPYLFFVAKADGSKTHDFSVSYGEHKVKAEAFRREMERRKIK